MSSTKNYGLSGVSTDVELGVAGLRIISDGTAVSMRNNANNAFVELKVADPTSDDAAVTKRFVERRYDVSVTDQIDGGAPPVVVDGAVYVCTTTGGIYTEKYLYRGESGSWVEIIPYNGMRIVVTTALTGGNITFTGDHVYLWDGDTSNWVDVGPYTLPGQFVKSVRANLAFGSGGTVNIGSQVPTNARPYMVIINVTQLFNGTGPTPSVTVGDAGSTARLMLSGESNLKKVGIYVVNCNFNYGSATQLTATFTAAGSGASTGAATIEVLYTTA